MGAGIVVVVVVVVVVVGSPALAGADGGGAGSVLEGAGVGGAGVGAVGVVGVVEVLGDVSPVVVVVVGSCVVSLVTCVTCVATGAGWTGLAGVGLTAGDTVGTAAEARVLTAVGGALTVRCRLERWVAMTERLTKAGLTGWERSPTMTGSLIWRATGTAAEAAPALW